ncbi:MAG: tRNA pseudouridine(55) synthase TruB, partial [Azonexus sp.]
IGQALGCGAHLAALRRTAVGDLDLAGAVTLAELEALDEAGRAGRLQPVDALLQSLPIMTVEGEVAERFRHGNPVDIHPGLAGKIRVYAGGRLIGVGEPGSDGRLWPKRLVQLAA